MASDRKFGKFVDRCPGVKAAGVKTKIVADDTVHNCVHHLSTDEIVQSIINAQPKPKPPFRIPPKNPPYTPLPIYLGFNSDISKVLVQPKKTFFAALKDELKETAYKSYWLNELGALPDQTANLPVGMNMYTTVFGKPSHQASYMHAGDLINPKKCPHIVEKEAMKGKELYKISHKAYLPGEQVKHDPMMKFPPNLIFGKTTLASYDGKGVNTLMNWIDQNEVSTTSQSLAFFRYRHHHELGKPLKRIGIPKKFDKCFTFGKVERKEKDFEENPSLELAEQVAFVYNMKINLRKKHFNFLPLLTNLRELDVEGTGILEQGQFFDIVKSYGLQFYREKIDPICKKLKIYTDDGKGVYYDKFCALINPAEDLPNFGKVIPKSRETTYSSEYMSMCSDLQSKDEKQPAAGLPSNPLKFGEITIPAGMCKANHDDLPSETDVSELLRPNIFLQYGLSHRDFFQPRTKNFLRDLWAKVGVDIPGNIFEMLWAEGERRDGVENVSIETFRNMLDEVSTGRLEQLSPLKM
ncbi:EF-hand domain-containing family member B-like isoform X2 [Cimex lectularius]|uniref:EFHB C-terminal EF-hand domain-containing protein n=1 Tax=Cimex lectularius TaxID=79782 RepID=A0A8I6S3W4_CIMLE|nr:EF-hand domain-containing family member B-like isoform X2 [Cimex lectularius]